MNKLLEHSQHSGYIEPRYSYRSLFRRPQFNAGPINAGPNNAGSEKLENIEALFFHF